jgi:hypothetical protein
VSLDESTIGDKWLKMRLYISAVRGVSLKLWAEIWRLWAVFPIAVRINQFEELYEALTA